MKKFGFLFLVCVSVGCDADGNTSSDDVSVDLGHYETNDVFDDSGLGDAADSEINDASNIDQGAEPVTEPGCEGTALLVNPDDPASTGPWPVGARTVMIENLRTEVWYPASPGSAALLGRKIYDVREHLPDNEQGKIPDENNPWQECPCFSDIPLDTERGPYPIVIFFHGTAGFRTQSLTQTSHWASRGFVVIAADHPLLELKDVLLFKFGADLVGDAKKILSSLEQGDGGFAFLKAHIDLNRIAVIGHSAGGLAAAQMGAHPGVQIVIPMAAGGASDVSVGVETVVMGATEDQVVPYSQQLDGYAATPKPKRFVGLHKAGHLAFSDLCVLGADQGGLLDIAIRFGVNVNPLIANLAKDGCKDGQLSADDGLEIINFATSAALEARLHCSPDAGDWFEKLPLNYESIVVDYDVDM
ncbi:MAG: hypothetical protein HUU55_16220 [Myxococcales bacterium]|nr:hypothetical protein [Myxococcales bacterium]